MCPAAALQIDIIMEVEGGVTREANPGQEAGGRGEGGRGEGGPPSSRNRRRHNNNHGRGARGGGGRGGKQDRGDDKGRSQAPIVKVRHDWRCPEVHG